MKTCEKCGELNGEERETCWKCGNDLRVRLEDTYQKFCPKCGAIYPKEAERCEKCGGPLGVYSAEAVRRVNEEPAEEKGHPVMYILSFLFPLVGLVLGLVQGIKGKVSLCCALILTAVGGAVLWGLINAVMRRAFFF